ncbi:TolC family outer membrane protein [Pseudooceanicola sp.]|uniref:TolC family outer membrane protein n=1 Tax=Pseudooceanicola sp. TaxID=1914328 RepID=UPI0026196902|nr:TolC family outer membrane protein [Pseudooceanicola sp.]MDF1856249.1 TolC family outer membrane protein [Pseudooceanicola sp.]
MTLGLALSAPLARAQTLADTLVAAYNNSGLLEQNRALLRAADESVPQAVSALRPILNWSANVSHSWTRASSASSGFTATTSRSTALSLGLSLQLLIYDFGASKVRIDVAKESVLGTRHNLIAAEQQVLLRAVQSFFEVRRATETLTLRQNNLRLITQELRAARDRFEVGEVTRTDVSLAEARLAAARSGLAAAEGALNRAKLEYRAATGVVAKGLTSPRSLPGLPATVDAAMMAAARQHPDVLAAQQNVTVAELNVTLADLALRPTVNLNATYGLTENLNNKGYSSGLTVGIGASGPIYAGGRLSSLQRQTFAQRDAARSNLHVVVDNVQRNAGNAYSDVLVARASRLAGEQQVRASEIAFRGVREESTLGSRTTLDVLNAEQELLQARADLISAQIDEYIGAYALLAAQGRLTAAHLRLGVQIFDPTAYYNMVKDAPAGLSERGKRLDRVLRKIGKD